MQYSNSSSAFKPFSSSNETIKNKSLSFTSYNSIDYNRTEDEIYFDNELVNFWNKMNKGLTRESIKEYVKNIMNFLFCQRHSYTWCERTVSYLFIMWGETRDCRGNLSGKGWRDGSHWLLLELLNYFPKTAIEMVSLYPVFGSWRDLQKLFEIVKSDMKKNNCNFSKLKMIENKIYSMWHTQLLEDNKQLELASSENKPEISLCVKYVPKEGKRLDKMYKVTKKLAARMFPEHITPITKALKMFRKFCSPLNKAINTTECLMCSNRYSEINYHVVPSRCLRKNVKAFKYEKRNKVEVPDIDRIKGSENYNKFINELDSSNNIERSINKEKTWQSFENTMKDERYRDIFELLEKVKETPYLSKYKAPELSSKNIDIKDYKNMTNTELKNKLKQIEYMMKLIQNKIDNNNSI